MANQPITDTTNYLLVACQLKERGYLEVPSTSLVLDEIALMKNTQLSEWAREMAARPDFRDTVAFHLQGV